MNIIPRHYTTIGCTDKNTARMKNAFRKVSEKYRKRRKVIRGGKRPTQTKKNRKKETYEYGGFLNVFGLILCF